MRYKSAVLGCGPRAEYHVLAYDGLDEIELTALCDMDNKRLNDFGDKFKIQNLYADLETMLDEQGPDILHIVTMPDFRAEPMELAAKFGVKGIIVEKPVALNPAQADNIKKLVDRTGLKVAVNTQRRYFQTCRDLKKILDEGAIGQIEFVRGMTKGNILSMGPHMVDLVLYFLNDPAPVDAFACAYGMNGYDYSHPAPANMMIRYRFDDITVYMEDAEDALGTPGETEFWMHFELEFWGTKGRAWWTQNRDWGYQAHGMSELHTGASKWFDSDVPGQREFTRAMAQWLDDDSKVHLNCLDTNLKGFDMIIGAMQSAYTGKCVKLPAKIDNDLTAKLEARLK